MGLEVFDLSYEQSQARAVEVATAEDVLAIAPCPDLCVRVASPRAEVGIVDALQQWLEANAGQLQTLEINAAWIFLDRLPQLDLGRYSELVGVRARSVHLSPTLLELPDLEYLGANRSEMPIDGPLAIGGSVWPKLVNCDFTDTRVGTSELVLSGADHLQTFGYSLDQDYGDGTDPRSYRIEDCPALVDVWIGISSDIRVEVAGDLPSLKNVWINPGERSYEFEHGGCGRHPVEEVVAVYDDDRGDYEVAISDYDGTGFPDRYHYRF